MSTPSPISTFLAEALLQDLEKKTVNTNTNTNTNTNNTNTNSDISFCKRYVDDAFAIVKTNEIENVLQTIDNTAENIAFTKEAEFSATTNSPSLTYRSPRTTTAPSKHRYCIQKEHPYWPDINLQQQPPHRTQNLLHQVTIPPYRNTLQHPTNQARWRNYLYETFLKSNYPKNFINKITSQKRWTQENINTFPDETQQDKKRKPVPYIHTVSERTARVLRQYNVEVAHKPTIKHAANFTRHKDRTTNTDRRNAIYMFPCRDCPQQYIGETSKKVETRLTEHCNAIKRHDPKSLLASHADD